MGKKGQLERLAAHLTEQRDILAAQGKEFVIFIAPNKERIYSEYMPERYGVPAENYAALQVYDYMKTYTDIQIVYPYAELMEAKNRLDEDIYYPTDTHWNRIGGYVGAAALLSELGVEMPSIYGDSLSISSEGYAVTDLANMIGLPQLFRHASKFYTVRGYDLHNMEWEYTSISKGDCRSDAPDERVLYLLGDSYYEAMEDCIASQFAELHLRRPETYTYDDFVACDPDIVVVECVERYVGRLYDFSFEEVESQDP